MGAGFDGYLNALAKSFNYGRTLNTAHKRAYVGTYIRVYIYIYIYICMYKPELLF